MYESNITGEGKLYFKKMQNRCEYCRDFCRAMLCISAAYAVMRCLSVRPSRSWIVSKQINVSSKNFHHRVPKPFQFFLAKRHDNTLTETPLNGASNAGGVGRNRDSEPISGFTSCCKPFHRQVQIHLAATDYGEFITLVAGKRRSLLIAGNNDEVYDKKPQLYAEDNVTRRQW